MKSATYFLILVIAGISFTSLNSCKKCSGEDPRARIINNGTNKASVQIKTSGGNTVNINNVDKGTTSALSSYAPGLVTFTVAIENINYEIKVQMDKCYDYDIKIDGSNNISSTSTNRN